MFNSPKRCGLMNSSPTGAPAAAARSRSRRSRSACAFGSRVWLNEFRYSLNDLDSTMLGLSAGKLKVAMATRGLPRASSHESS
ncbi:Uncharacterised protein [Bordetella pertussis]|nr:Uncharacterised protein [Bordetella pertussis]